MPPKPAHIAFATNLRNAMNRKGFTQSELMARANSHAPKTHKLSRSNLSEYCNGKKLPGPIRLDAIAKALDVAIEELVPATMPRTRIPLAATQANTELINIGNGQARMTMDRTMPWPKAMEVMSILNSINKDKGHK